MSTTETTETTQTATPESIRKDAELVVDVCMSVDADDVVTIITDDDHYVRFGGIE